MGGGQGPTVFICTWTPAFHEPGGFPPTPCTDKILKVSPPRTYVMAILIVFSSPFCQHSWGQDKEGYFVIAETDLDGVTLYLLINDRTGRRHYAIGYPDFCPDRKYFACVSMDLNAQLSPNGIQIWKVGRDSLQLEYQYGPTNWGPSEASWLSNDSLLVTKSVPTDSTIESYSDSKVFVVRHRNKWQMSK